MKRTLLTRKRTQAEQYATAMNRSRLGSAQQFAAWLNQKSPAAEKISAMLGTLQTALAVARDARRRGVFGIGDAERARFDEMAEQFNASTACYTGKMVWSGLFWPENTHLLQRVRKREKCLRLTAEEMERAFLPPEPITSFERANDIPVDEWNGFLSLLQLMREKQIDRLRRCDFCQKWMFVRVPYGDRHQRFCPGGKCLNAWRKSSPEYKASQAEHMRKLRRIKKRYPNHK